MSESRPTSSPSVELGDEDRGVRVALERPDVAALVADAAPARVGEQPALRLARDRARERDERGRVARLRARPDAGRAHPDDDAGAASARVAGGGEPSRPASTSTAAAPPKKRFRRRQRTTS